MALCALAQRIMEGMMMKKILKLAFVCLAILAAAPILKIAKGLLTRGHEPRLGVPLRDGLTDPGAGLGQVR